jgi:hypothetical protein
VPNSERTSITGDVYHLEQVSLPIIGQDQVCDTVYIADEDGNSIMHRDSTFQYRGHPGEPKWHLPMPPIPFGNRRYVKTVPAFGDGRVDAHISSGPVEGVDFYDQHIIDTVIRREYREIRMQATLPTRLPGVYGSVTLNPYFGDSVWGNIRLTTTNRRHEIGFQFRDSGEPNVMELTGADDLSILRALPSADANRAPAAPTEARPSFRSMEQPIRRGFSNSW